MSMYTYIKNNLMLATIKHLEIQILTSPPKNTFLPEFLSKSKKSWQINNLSWASYQIKMNKIILKC